jgi:peptidoglycan/LPS O-acetylase OafA/YrhL
MGVPVFFVVSGFCIHVSFQQQGQRWGSFFIRRFFRIYPAYLAALIFFTSIYMEHYRLNFHSLILRIQLVTHLFLIHNCFPLTNAEINSPFWSLAVEAQLYLLYPALLVLVAKLGWRRSMMILAGCELMIRGMDGLIFTVGATKTIGCQISWILSHSPLGFWFSWALGAYIADAFLKNQPLPFTKTSPILWFALGITAYLVKPLYPFRFLLFAVVTAVIASQHLGGARPKVKIPIFSLNVLKNIGLWSYSIYLLHQPLLFIYFFAIDGVMPEENRSEPASLLLVVVTWLAIIPFSILWYKLFELPGIALGKRIIKKMAVGYGTKIEPKRLIGNVPAGMLRGGYGLMIVTLLALIVGSFLANAKFFPPEPDENNNLAWSLATSPDATKRNGARAVKLAEDACQRTHYQVTIMVGTLAATYAEAGRFDEAILMAQRACSMAEKIGETNLLQKNQELLKLYQNHQPYHESNPNPH